MIEYALTYMKAISVVAATVLVVARVAMAAWRTVTQPVRAGCCVMVWQRHRSV